MKSLWDEVKAQELQTDLALRVYSSNLLGGDDTLVLHGGGNTSVKIDDILYVKGSGWDLASIKPEGFAPVKLQTLQEMAKLATLSDTDMVTQQKAAMLDPSAPNPSVEAILHALIPYKFVDHTHADAVITISNSKDGQKLIQELYPSFLIVPYVMPGFILARKIYEMTQNFDWHSCGGIILHHHGIFTFDDDAKISYEKMIKAVSSAEEFLSTNARLNIPDLHVSNKFDLKGLKELISKEKDYEVSLHVNTSPLAKFYASQDDLEEFATRGVLTPEHIIRTKRVPLIFKDNDISSKLEKYKAHYKAYFSKFAKEEICLNLAPNYAVVKDFGIIVFGKNEKEANIINDIIEHTMFAVLRADKLGGYKSISLKDSFDMEYWELEQAKLRR
ncbi:MAG: class II aldolase/adducin family protein [Sulfurospirillum sp.]|nr:class II aldolase/adducin family protein [Sulfurospirillum sp.]